LKEEEEMRTHCIIVEHGALIEMREIYFDFWKSFVSIVRVCCFGVFIILSLLDLNFKTRSKQI
jgi:hypothetical protein